MPSHTESEDNGEHDAADPSAFETANNGSLEHEDTQDLERPKSFGPLAFLILFAIGAVIGLVAFFGVPAALPLYSFWRVEQQLQQAENLLNSSDGRSAQIMLRNAYRHATNLPPTDERRKTVLKRLLILMSEASRQTGDTDYPVFMGMALELDPKDEQLAVRTIRAVIESQRQELANLIVPLVLQNFSENPEVLHLVGIMLLERGELDAGYNTLKKALDLAPDKKAIKLSLGTIEALSKDVEVAERGIKILLEARQDPEFYKVATNSLAEIYSLNNKQRSLELWEELIQKHPDEFDLRIKKILVQHNINPELTRPELDRLWAQFNKLPDRLQIIIRALSLLGVSSSRELLDRLPAVDRVTPPAMLLQITLDASEQKWPEVLHTARELSQNQEAPTHQQVVGWLWMARAQRMLGNDDVVSTSLRNAAQKAGDSAQLLLLCAQQLESWNMNTEAQIFYRQAAKLGGPAQLLALNNMARYAQFQRNSSELMEIYEMLYKIQPNNALVLNNLAALLLMRNQDLPRALDLIQQVYLANKANQRIPQIADTYALALALNGRVAEALEIYSTVQINALDNPAIRLHLARVLSLAGKRDEAWQIIQPINSKDLFREEQELLEQLRRELL